MNHRLIGEELLDLAENEVPPEDIVFHRFYMNKSGPIKPKAKKKDSVLDEDTGELLADNADEDGEYDYDDLDSNAFDEEKDLLRDDSDAELDDISDSASMDDGSGNDDDDIASFTGMDAEALEDEGDSDGNSSDEMVDAGNGVAPMQRKRWHWTSGKMV